MADTGASGTASTGHQDAARPVAQGGPWDNTGLLLVIGGVLELALQAGEDHIRGSVQLLRALHLLLGLHLRGGKSWYQGD